MAFPTDDRSRVLSGAPAAIESALSYLTHKLTCDSYANNADLSEPGSRRDHVCTCGMQAAWARMKTVSLFLGEGREAATNEAIGRDFAKEASQSASPGRVAPDEPLVWESTTPCFIRFVSDRRYNLFSPKVRRWYRPICPNCGPRRRWPGVYPALAHSSPG